jgi:hypothetical protein
MTCPPLPRPCRGAPALVRLPLAALVLSALVVLMSACASPTAVVPQATVQLPVLRGWFDGQIVFYVTTDASEAGAARKMKANFAPRLAQALPRGPQTPGQASALDKVYAVTNFEQPSIFASAPDPMGPESRDPAYSPLWRMVTVTWAVGQRPRELRSEEQVLAAAEAGQVVVEPTDVVVNCPIVHRGPGGGLEGAALSVGR